MKKPLLLLAGAVLAVVATPKSTAELSITSTKTVSETTTRTAQTVVLITVKPGTVTNTTVCDGSTSQVSASDSPLETLSLTSTTTSVVTSVVTPSDATTTIYQTSTPVITITVVPILVSVAGQSPAKTLNHTCSGKLSISYGTTRQTVLDSTAIAYPTGYSPLRSHTTFTMPHKQPDGQSSLPVSSHPSGTIHNPGTTTRGHSPISSFSSAGRIRPNRMLALLVQMLALGDLAQAQTLHPRFYPWPTPLNSGPPPHLTTMPPLARVESKAAALAEGTETIATTLTTTLLQTPRKTVASISAKNDTLASIIAVTGCLGASSSAAKDCSILLTTSISKAAIAANRTEAVSSIHIVTSTVPGPVHITSTITSQVYTTEMVSATNNTLKSAPVFGGPSMSSTYTAGSQAFSMAQKLVLAETLICVVSVYILQRVI